MNTGAFQGVVEFELRISLFGNSVKRRARLVYTLTPLWPYFNISAGADVKATADHDFRLELLALPRAEAARGHPRSDPHMKPTWVTADDLLKFGVLNRRLLQIMYESVDADARRRDAENRAKWRGEDPTTTDLL